MEKIEIKGLKETIYTDTCKNGLKVYVWVNEKVKSTFMSLSVKFGSINTEFSYNGTDIQVPNGTAHFLEHVKFNEKDGSTAHDYFKKLGSDVNAFTTFEYTSYIVFSMNKIKENLNHLLDFVQTPVFSAKLIQKEKGIIIEEARMGEDDPGNISFFGTLNSLFKNYKYKNLITGTPDEIKNINVSDIENVYDAFYNPKNMFLVVTGNVNPYEIMSWVNENQESKTFEDKEIPLCKKEKEPTKVVEERKVIEANVTTPMTKIAIKIPKKQFNGFSDIEIRVLLNLILSINFGSTSDFNNDLKAEKLLTSLTSSVSFLTDYVVIMINYDSIYPEEVEKRIIHKLNNLEVDEKDFRRKVNANIATLVLGYDDIEAVNYKIQDNIMDYGEVISDMKEFYENLKFERMISIVKLLDTKNMAILTLVPKKKAS